jgi:ribosome-associated protein
LIIDSLLVTHYSKLNDGILKDRNRVQTRGRTILEGIEIARKAVEAASEKQASDIVLLDVSKICTFADYFVICSGDSARQLSAIGDEVEHILRDLGEHVIHHEGTASSGWLLYDYTDVLVHIFGPDERKFYQLEELWNQATPVIRIQ